MFADCPYEPTLAHTRETGPMGAIMTRCPRTGREIATGIEMDEAEFKRAPVFFSRVHCPLCAREHEWFAKDAWVCDGPDVPSPARRSSDRPSDR